MVGKSKKVLTHPPGFHFGPWFQAPWVPGSLGSRLYFAVLPCL